MTLITLEYELQQRTAEYLFAEMAAPNAFDERTVKELVAILRKHLGDLDELARKGERPEFTGFSLAEAQSIARNQLKTVDLYARLLDLITSSPFGPANPVEDLRVMLAKFHKKARTLLRISNRPPPVFDPERYQSALAEMERGEGVDPEELLAQLTREGAA